MKYKVGQKIIVKDDILTYYIGKTATIVNIEYDFFGEDSDVLLTCKFDDENLDTCGLWTCNIRNFKGRRYRETWVKDLRLDKLKRLMR